MKSRFFGFGHIVILAFGLLMVMANTAPMAPTAEAGNIPPQTSQMAPASYGPTSFSATQTASNFTLDAPNNQWQTVKVQPLDANFVPISGPGGGVFTSEPYPGIPAVSPSAVWTGIEVGSALNYAILFGKIPQPQGCSTLKEKVTLTGAVNPTGQLELDNTEGVGYLLAWFSRTNAVTIVAPGAKSLPTDFIGDDSSDNIVYIASFVEGINPITSECGIVYWNLTEAWLGVGKTWMSPAFTGWNTNLWLPGSTTAKFQLYSDSDKTTTINLSTSTTCSGMIFTPSAFTVTPGAQLNTLVNVSVHPSTSHGALCPIYVTGTYDGSPYPGPVEIAVVTIS